CRMRSSSESLSGELWRRAVVVSIEQSVASGPANQVRGVVCADLVIDVFTMCLHGLDADGEPRGDPAVRKSFDDDEVENFALSRCEGVQQASLSRRHGGEEIG